MITDFIEKFYKINRINTFERIDTDCICSQNQITKLEAVKYSGEISISRRNKI